MIIPTELTTPAPARGTESGSKRGTTAATGEQVPLDFETNACILRTWWPIHRSLMSSGVWLFAPLRSRAEAR